MITRIDINCFGSFDKWAWNNHIRDKGNNVQDFKRLNILYGRNYSGKTTLSRIFRSLETGKLPLTYSSPNFCIYGDQRTNIDHTNFATHSYDVRVYNRDFVTDNLSFLTDQSNGEVKTFAIVGEENKDVESRISEIELQLGTIESKSGHRYHRDVKQTEKDNRFRKYTVSSELLEKKLTSHANDKIKRNREYENVTYNINSLKKDISTLNSSDSRILSSQDKALKLTLLKQEALPKIPSKINISLGIEPLKEMGATLLGRTITPTQPIQELLNDAILQLWVKQGVTLHKEKRETCAFCGQNLPDDLWYQLDSHFSGESSELESQIDNCLMDINSEFKSVPGLEELTETMFYPEERALFEVQIRPLQKELAAYSRDLSLLRDTLAERKNNLFQIVSVPVFEHDSSKIQLYVASINKLIDRSNSRTNTLEADKQQAREALRLDDVASFVETIDYEGELKRIEALKQEADFATESLKDSERAITDLQNELVFLRSKLKDERLGAERVNALLNHYFGHDGIKLEAKDFGTDAAVRFEITRNGHSAYNLSEGECSLISFCYFMAKLEEPESRGKDLIIYIDDPISSLDSNHIFFLFSLIESLIARPSKVPNTPNPIRYKQLFISTHNLEFLKYLKRLSSPTKAQGGQEYFLVERIGTQSSLSLMPKYLSQYLTEFNYLFHQIYKCRSITTPATDPEAYYAFGNNLRKFLEAFLFYKYPYMEQENEPNLPKLTRFFGDDDLAAILTARLDNELSHLEKNFDRSMKPIDIPEITKIANYVLDKMFETDAHQFNALLKSIGEPERIK